MIIFLEVFDHMLAQESTGSCYQNCLLLVTHSLLVWWKCCSRNFDEWPEVKVAPQENNGPISEKSNVRNEEKWNSTDKSRTDWFTGKGFGFRRLWFVFTLLKLVSWASRRSRKDVGQVCDGISFGPLTSEGHCVVSTDWLRGIDLTSRTLVATGLHVSKSNVRPENTLISDDVQLLFDFGKLKVKE